MARSWTRSTTLQPPRVVRLRRWTRSRCEIMDGGGRCEVESGGQARVRGGRPARRKPRVRRAGVEIERQRGGWGGGEGADQLDVGVDAAGLVGGFELAGAGAGEAEVIGVGVVGGGEGA